MGRSSAPGKLGVKNQNTNPLVDLGKTWYDVCVRAEHDGGQGGVGRDADLGGRRAPGRLRLVLVKNDRRSR